MTDQEKFDDYVQMIMKLYDTQASFELDNFGQIVIYTGLQWNEDHTKMIELDNAYYDDEYLDDDLDEDES